MTTTRKNTKAAKALWTEYEAVMMAARKAALDLATALESYIRGRETDWSRFDAACRAADVYCAARAAAEPYHFGTIPVYSSSDVVNATATELLSVVSSIRADDGIAGFYAIEVQSMRRFGCPRRTPAKAA